MVRHGGPASFVGSLIDHCHVRRGMPSCVQQNAIVWRHRWASFDYDDSVNELQESRLVLDPPTDVNELVECYDTTLVSLLDKFAPRRQKTTARPSAPCTTQNVGVLKQITTRKLEKRYRRNPSDLTRSAWRLQFSNQRVLFQKKLTYYLVCRYRLMSRQLEGVVVKAP